MKTKRNLVVTKSGQLHGSTRCIVCQGRHDGANLVKMHAITKAPVHTLCIDQYDASTAVQS